MKLCWRNMLWNHTTRYGYLLEYYIKGRYKKPFKEFYFPGKRPQTQKEKDQFEKKMHELLTELVRL